MPVIKLFYSHLELICIWVYYETKKLVGGELTKVTGNNNDNKNIMTTISM